MDFAKKNNEWLTMAIINCFFSPTLEVPSEFPTWCVLAKLNAKPRNEIIHETDGTHSPKANFNLRSYADKAS
jgi:hypothetical protein